MVVHECALWGTATSRGRNTHRRSATTLMVPLTPAIFATRNKLAFANNLTTYQLDTFFDPSLFEPPTDGSQKILQQTVENRQKNVRLLLATKMMGCKL